MAADERSRIVELDSETLDALATTRHALKGLQRQARQTLQLATNLEERLDALLATRTAQGGPANNAHEDRTLTSRAA